MIPFEKGEGKASDKPGTWYAWQRHTERPVVDIVCPLCGHCFFLEQGERGETSGPSRYSSHGVSASGVVTPSVVCPWNCRFHQWIFLRDWTHGGLPEVV